MQKYNKKTKWFLIIIIFYGLLFSSISLVNHYNFRTYAFDLGINNNAIYDYAHFRWNDCMVMQPQFKNILSDHFSLLPILISPLYWIFGTYTMLIFQIAAILAGGIGIYKYFQFKYLKDSFAYLAMIHFFSIWGVYSALAFDYHDNVIAAMFVPWFILFFEKKEWKNALIFFFLICVSKENMALWAFFISIGLIILHYKEKLMLKWGGIFAFSSVFYFFLVVKILMPLLANEGRDYLHFNYSALGENFSEAIKTVIIKPVHTLALLFKNHLNTPDGNGIKSELHYMILLSGGIALLFKPQYFIMLIPVYAQKLFNDDFTKWGLNSHYSIEFVPILTLALFTWIGELKVSQNQLILVMVCLVTLGATLSSMNHRVSKWYSPVQQRFYQKQHYSTEYNVKEIQKALRMIPENAKVSASSPLVPHLAFRDYIYQYPIVKNAEFIVLFDISNTYPLSAEAFEKKKNEVIKSEEWQTIYSTENLKIFKRDN